MKDITATKQNLKELLKAGEYRIYIIQRSVSASGMTRKLDLYTIIDNRPHYITTYAASVLGWGLDKNYRLIVRGCGMDMHFHTVYSLSCALYNDEGYTKEGAYKLQHETL